MARRIEYQIGFSADTTALQTALNQAMQSLQKIGTNPSFSLTTQLKSASNAALDLANNLRTAYNQETGKLDLTTFNNSLKQSGMTLKQYSASLASLGSTGEQAFLNVAQAIAKAELPLKRSNKLLNDLWISMKNTMRWQLTSSMLHGFMRSVSTAYGYTKDLNESLNSIRIVTGKNIDEMDKFAASANKAAKALSTTTVDYTDASLIYYQQGLDDEKVQARTETTIKLANVAGESAQAASEQLTAIWNNFEDGSKSLEYYADVMTALGAATASSTQEISAGLQKFAAVASSVGLSYEYATAALATITATTRESADVVGTSLRTLFARIQGLMQDESQDDGTTLNKYSKALAQVGIDIKDTSGEMRDMNDILMEMGERWTSLSRAQQLALAQTVAGVRQYSQLIALMENFDFFKENINIAMGSEGTLQEQADIYAESWEAARDRVRAAWEDIYDSIINDDFFIELDNSLTPFLSGIATAIDALGGMKGALILVAAAMTNVYGEKIAQGIRNIGTNIGIVSGYESMRARELQRQAVELSKNLTISMAATKTGQLRLNILQEEISLQGTINQKIDSLDASQRQWLETEQFKLSILKLQNEEYIKSAAQRSANVGELQETIRVGIQPAQNWQNNIIQEIRNFNQLNRQNKINLGINLSTANVDQAFEKINDQLVSLQNKRAVIENIRTSLSGMSRTAKTLGAEDLKTINDQLAKIGMAPIQGVKTAKDIINQLGIESRLSQSQVDTLSTSLKTLGGDPKLIQQYIGALFQLAQSEDLAQLSTDELAEKMRKLVQQLQNGIPSTKDWATKLVSATSALSRMAMAFQAFKNIGRVFEDSDMDNGDRLISILMSLSMIIPVLSGVWSLFNKERELSFVLEGATVKATAASTSGFLAQKIAVELSSGALVGHAKALGLNTKEQIANTAARYASNLVLVAVIAAVVALGLAIRGLVKWYNKDADAAKESAERAKELKNAYTEVKKSYEDLKKSLADYQDARDGLDELIKGTEEWNEAVQKINEQVLNLLDLYPKLAQYISSSDGILEISEEGQEELLKEQKERTAESYRSYLAGSAYANNEQNQSLRTDFEREANLDFSKKVKDTVIEGIKIGLGIPGLFLKPDFSKIADLFSVNASDEEIEKVISAINTQGEGILLNTETLQKATGISSSLAKVLIENRESLLKLSQQVSANTQSNKILQQQIGQSFLEGSKDADNEQLAMLMGKAFQESFEREYEDTYKDKGIFGGMSDAEIQQRYAAAQGYIGSKNLSGNKAEYTTASGEVKTISDEVARTFLARQAAEEETLKKQEEFSLALQDLINTFTGENENVQNALANLGVNVADFSELTKSDVETIKGLNFDNVSKGTLETLGFSSTKDLETLRDQAISNWDEGMNNLTSDMAYSVQEAFNKLDISGKTLAESQFIAKALSRASAYGKLDEAIAAYKEGSLEEFTEELGITTTSIEEDYSKVHKIIDKLEKGDVLSPDDYADLGSLADGYFTKMLDGTYKLTETASDFKQAVQDILIGRAKEEVDRLGEENQGLSKISGYNIEELSKLNYYQKDNGEFAYSTEVLQQQLDIIRELNRNSGEVLESVDRWQQKLNQRDVFSSEELQEIADAVANCRDSFDGLDETIASNTARMSELDLQIAYSYENLRDLREAYQEDTVSIQAFTEAAVALDKTTDTQNLDTDEWEDFADYLKDSAKEMENLNDEMDDNEARIVAKGIMKMNDAIDILADNFEDWGSILRESSKDSEEYSAALIGCKNAVAELLDVNSNFVSNNFIADNLNLIEQAATGSAEAIDELKSKLADAIIAQIIIDNKLENGDAILEGYNNLKANIPDLIVGATIEDGDFLEQMQALVTNANMTVDQVNALFDAMGFEAKFATKEVPMEQRVPEYVTETVDDGTTYDAERNLTFIRTRTRTYQDGYYTAEGKMDAIAMTTNGKTPQISGITKKATGSYNNYSSKNPGGKSPGKNKSSGSKKDNTGKLYDKEDAKKLDEIVDRYHEINREIERQADLLDDIQNESDRAYGVNKLKAYKKELVALQKQQENYQEKLTQANKYLEVDTKAMKDRFGEDVILDETTGEITNYTELMTAKWDEYKAFVDAYNAEREVWGTWTKDQQEAKKTYIEQREAEFKAKEKEIELDKEIIEQYEKTLDEQRELKDKMQETAREIADNRLSQIELRLEVVLDVKSMKDALRDLEKSIQEIFNDALTHGIKVSDIERDQAKADMSMIPEYQDQFARYKAEYESAITEADWQRIINNIKNLQGDVIDTAESLIEWWDSIEDILPDMLDAAAERYKLFTDQLKHNTTVVDSIKELYALQGVTYKTEEGFNKLQKASQEKLEAQVAQASIERRRAEELQKRLAQAQANLDSLNGDETDPRYDTYKKARDALLEQFNEATEAQLSLAKEAMETAKQMYEEQIDKAVYDFGQKVSKGLGLDLLQEKFDHYVDQESFYLDPVNEAYETLTWYNKIQADIDKTTNNRHKEQLKLLQQEIDLRRENGTLTEHDLEVLEKKYQILQAQMALEDTQNNKTQLRLVRDRQGNWNYQYTADQDDVTSKQQEMLDAMNEYYNISKDRATELVGDIINLQKELADKIAEIDKDSTLSPEEKQKRILEIETYYKEKREKLVEELNNTIKDMNDAGAQLNLAIVRANGENITGATNFTAKQIEEITNKSWSDITDVMLKGEEAIENILGESSSLVDAFENTYAENISDMVVSTEEFNAALDETLNKCEDHFNDFQDTIENVADQTGTTMDDLADIVDQVSDSTDELTWRADDAADAIWRMYDAAKEAVDGYLDMADAIWEVINAAKELATQQANYVEQKADLDNPEWQTGYGSDISYDLGQAYRGGADIFDRNSFGAWWDARAEKRGASGESLTNDQLWRFFQLVDQGDPTANAILDQVLAKKGTYHDLIKQYGVRLATGGYTGDFEGEKLAFLHEKELVLNKGDTENFLEALKYAHDSIAETNLNKAREKYEFQIALAELEEQLNFAADYMTAMMSQGISAIKANSATQTIEQYIHIDEVSFPNATYADEIKQAFASLANDAVQWAGIRRI